MRQRDVHLTCLLFLGCAGLPAHAGDAVRLTTEWDLRLRHEQVQDDAFTLDADATTLRARLGLRLAAGNGFTALLEGEGIAATGAYNSGANGRGNLPAVTDPLRAMRSMRRNQKSQSSSSVATALPMT